MNLQTFPKRSHLRFGLLLGLLLTLILIRYAFQVDIPRIVLLAVIALTALLGDKNEIIALCIAFIPMHESIDFYFALVICMAVYILRYFREFRIGYAVLLVFVVCIWEALHCLQSTFSVVDFLTCIIPFIIMSILMATDIEQLDYSFIVRLFSLSTLGIILILFIRVLYFSDFNIATALLGLDRLGSDLHSGIEDVTVSGGQINPNSLGVITVLAVTGLMQLRRMGKGTVGDVVLMCVMILFATLSASRTYLICLALMFFLLIISEKGGLKKKIKLISFICIAIAVIVIVLLIFFPSTFEYFVNRFMVDDITTGRGDLMGKYHQFILSDPKNLFFGIGLQDYRDRLVQIYNVADVTPHNFLQEIIVAWGIPGLIIFAVLLFNMFYQSSRHNRTISLINCIPLIIILVKSLAGQLLTSSYTMLALSYAYLSLCQDFSYIRDDNNQKIKRL